MSFKKKWKGRLKTNTKMHLNTLNTSNVLILLRGLPGCGKTTLATILSEKGTYPVFSVDDYFTNPETNEYKFNYKENHIAYKQCEEKCEEAMKNFFRKIFIANTFTQEWEMKPYFKLAAKYKYLIFVATVENYLENKNVHFIPNEQIKKMAEKYKVKLM